MNILIGNLIIFLSNLVEVGFDVKFNEKSKLLLGTIIKLIIYPIGMIFLGAYDGCVNALISLFRIVVTYFKDKYNKRWTIVFVIFMMLYLLPIFMFHQFRTWFLTIGVLCSFIPKWFSKSTKLIRLGNLIGNLISIVYAFYIFDFADVIMTAISIIGTIVALIKWRQFRKTNENEQNGVTDK